jgi:hypothetical protein
MYNKQSTDLETRQHFVFYDGYFIHQLFICFQAKIYTNGMLKSRFYIWGVNHSICFLIEKNRLAIITMNVSTILYNMIANRARSHIWSDSLELSEQKDDNDNEMIMSMLWQIVLLLKFNCTLLKFNCMLLKFNSNHLPLTAVGSNPDRDFGFFHVRKLSS